MNLLEKIQELKRRKPEFNNILDIISDQVKENPDCDYIHLASFMGEFKKTLIPPDDGFIYVLDFLKFVYESGLFGQKFKLLKDDGTLSKESYDAPSDIPEELCSTGDIVPVFSSF